MIHLPTSFWSPPIRLNTQNDGRDLLARIFLESDCEIEDNLASATIRVHAEEAVPLKLEPVIGLKMQHVKLRNKEMLIGFNPK